LVLGRVVVVVVQHFTSPQMVAQTIVHIIAHSPSFAATSGHPITLTPPSSPPPSRPALLAQVARDHPNHADLRVAASVARVDRRAAAGRPPCAGRERRPHSRHETLRYSSAFVALASASRSASSIEVISPQLEPSPTTDHPAPHRRTS